MKRTLRTGQPDDEFRLKLEEAVLRGEVCQRLAEACGKRGTTKGYTAIRDDLRTLSEQHVQPTVNVCRQWAVESAHYALASSNQDLFFDICRLWPAPGESKETLFDQELPVFACVAPTTEEEEAANEEPPEKPETLAELMVWEKDFVAKLVGAGSSFPPLVCSPFVLMFKTWFLRVYMVVCFVALCVPHHLVPFFAQSIRLFHFVVLSSWTAVPLLFFSVVFVRGLSLIR
jgi:hypothetical protein